MTRRIGPCAALAVLLAVLYLPVAAAARPIEDFFGIYAGESISHRGEGLSARDLGVTIKAGEGESFTLQWTTVTQEPGGQAKRKSYSIDFRPTNRPNVFAAAMRPTLFGGWEPLDPMKGEPYVWARLEGDTLTVYALMVNDDGRYEMQIYDRTLTADGMDLTFTRLREGEVFKRITGTLTRQRD